MKLGIVRERNWLAEPSGQSVRRDFVAMNSNNRVKGCHESVWKDGFTNEQENEPSK